MKKLHLKCGSTLGFLVTGKGPASARSLSASQPALSFVLLVASDSAFFGLEPAFSQAGPSVCSSIVHQRE